MPTRREVEDAIARYVRRAEDFVVLAAGAGVDPDEIRARVEDGIAEGVRQWRVRCRNRVA